MGTCNGHGLCSALTNSCECDIGYTTVHATDDDTTECNYKQKYQMNAFLLSLFLGEFGAGRFYVGDYLFGTIKLMLYVYIHLSECAYVYVYKHNMKNICWLLLFFLCNVCGCR